MWRGQWKDNLFAKYWISYNLKKKNNLLFSNCNFTICPPGHFLTLLETSNSSFSRVAPEQGAQVGSVVEGIGLPSRAEQLVSLCNSGHEEGSSKIWDRDVQSRDHPVHGGQWVTGLLRAETELWAHRTDTCRRLETYPQYRRLSSNDLLVLPPDTYFPFPDWAVFIVSLFFQLQDYT